MGLVGVALRRIVDLGEDLSAEIVLQEEVGHREYWMNDDRHHGDSSPSCWTRTFDSDEADEVRYVIDRPRSTKPDAEKRSCAKRDLRLIATDPDHQGIARYAAAKTLGMKTDSGFGYYSLRFFAHRHPVTATVTGIAFAGAVSGLVYTLLEYFSE